jgi:lipopolysaccharide/colanic/teichoic acid biosynthesis glycosyltransferase
LPYLGLTIAVAAPVLLAFGLNRSIWRLSTMADYMRVVTAVVVIVLAAMALGFMVSRLDGFARSLPILQAVLMIFLLVGARVLTRQRHAFPMRRVKVLTAMPMTKDARETVLVVGLNRITELYLLSAAEFAANRIRIAGLLGRCERHTGRLVQQQQVLGTPEEVANVLRALEVHGVSVDRILVTTALTRLSTKAQKALLEVEKASQIKLDLFAERIGLDECGTPRLKAGLEAGAGSAAFSFNAADLKKLADRPYWRIKRIIDFVGAACLAVILSPLVLLVAISTAIDLGLDVTFWQQRPGLGGHPFSLYKFRTMAAAHDAKGRRLSDEQRLSPAGRFLRRTRLDELPQLYNILLGEMSFVGPRPLLPADQPAAYAARLLVRPGLTGLAQVEGGREISASDKAALDVWYVRNASFALDLEILVRTVLMVVFGERVNRDAIRRAWRDLREAGVCTSTEIAGQIPFHTSVETAEKRRAA